MSITRRIHRPIIACVLVAFAITSAAAASAPQQDLRSPDARDTAAGRGTVNPRRDHVTSLRRPPARDRGGRQALAVVSQGAAPRRRPSSNRRSARVRGDEGIDWGDARIGAASLLGLIALGLAGAMTILHHRRRAGRTATVA